MKSRITRRKYLTGAAGIAATGVLAGCLDDENGENDTDPNNGGTEPNGNETNGDDDNGDDDNGDDDGPEEFPERAGAELWIERTEIQEDEEYDLDVTVEDIYNTEYLFIVSPDIQGDIETVGGEATGIDTVENSAEDEVQGEVPEEVEETAMINDGDTVTLRGLEGLEEIIIIGYHEEQGEQRVRTYHLQNPDDPEQEEIEEEEEEDED